MRFLHLADLHLGKRVNGFDMLEDQRYILEQIIDLCASRGVQAVVAAGDIYDVPQPPASAVLPFINEVELILVMTVEPGFGGQRFMADMMPKVQEIRRYIDAMNPGCELEVDGGVDPATCKICVASGANVLVAGSAVYKAADIPARIRELRG